MKTKDLAMPSYEITVHGVQGMTPLGTVTIALVDPDTATLSLADAFEQRPAGKHPIGADSLKVAPNTIRLACPAGGTPWSVSLRVETSLTAVGMRSEVDGGTIVVYSPLSSVVHSEREGPARTFLLRLRDGETHRSGRDGRASKEEP
jgi:hypothetical protein